MRTQQNFDFITRRDFSWLELLKLLTSLQKILVYRAKVLAVPVVTVFWSL